MNNPHEQNSSRELSVDDVLDIMTEGLTVNTRNLMKRDKAKTKLHQLLVRERIDELTAFGTRPYLPMSLEFHAIDITDLESWRKARIKELEKQLKKGDNL